LFSDPLAAFEYNGQQSIAVLRIANKYCMKGFEDKIVSRLQKAISNEEFLRLLEASQIMDSRELYVRAIRGLALSRKMITREEADIIGIQAFYDITACKCGQFKG
jgi:hypothetical protein